MAKRTHHKAEPLWHAQLAVLGALLLQLILPDKLVGAPKAIVIILEGLLLVGLTVTTPRLPVFESSLRRFNALALSAMITLFNVASVERLVHYLLLGGRITSGRELILASINIYLTNIIIFGLWYWELDGGGPGRRLAREVHERDFLFPQMSTPQFANHLWAPTFIDYLYISVTNAAAFSPTDTMPLSRRAKLLMSGQAFVSLITIALVAARAVNILS